MPMGLRALYMALREQIRDHDAILEAMRALARATLAVSAVVLGIMIISLGNLVALVNDGRLVGLSPMAETVVMVGIAAGLGGIMASVVFSVLAVGVSPMRTPISRDDFGKGRDVAAAIGTMAGAPDDEMYRNLSETCVKALEDREREISRVGIRTTQAQVSLLAGLLVAGTGVMIMFLALVSGSVQPA